MKITEQDRNGGLTVVVEVPACRAVQCMYIRTYKARFSLSQNRRYPHF